MRARLPPWFKQRSVDPEVMIPMAGLLDSLSLHTICESAHCPNIGDCFSHKTATFLILGDICTRYCSYCAVKKGQPLPVDDEAPGHLLEAVPLLVGDSRCLGHHSQGNLETTCLPECLGILNRQGLECLLLDLEATNHLVDLVKIFPTTG